MKLLSSAALALSLTVAGLGMHTAAVAGPKDQAQTKAVQAAKLSVVQAVELASQQGLKVYEVELDLERSQAIFEIKGVNAQNQKVELDLSAVDGKVLVQEAKGAADSKDVSRLAAAKVSLADAVAIAQKAEPGAVVEVELDEHNGALNYEVKVLTGGHGHKVRVNAQDGSVMAGKHNHKH